MGREGGVDGRNHVVLVLLVCISVLHSVRVAWLHGRHVCLHGEQRAVRGELRTVWDVHAAEVSSAAAIVAVHDVAVGQDVGESAFLAELAVALRCVSECLAHVSRIGYLCEVLAGRALSYGLVRVQERTGFSSLARALPVEFAGHM
jgi:hypothetical protein